MMVQLGLVAMMVRVSGICETSDRAASSVPHPFVFHIKTFFWLDVAVWRANRQIGDNGASYWRDTSLSEQHTRWQIVK